MQIDKTGFILYTINYEACLHFYGDILGLPILYKKKTLTCFDFHGSYLMVEIDDERDYIKSGVLERDRSCLRMNVSNVKDARNALDQQGISYIYTERDWGTSSQIS